MKTFTVKIGKGPDEMTFDECMAHIKRVLFWDYIDGEWCDVVPLNDRRWEELAGYIRGAHEREVDALKVENAKLRDLVYSILKCADEIDRDRGCDVCPMNTDGDLESYLDGTWCKLRPTLREVGFEVE